MTYVKELRVTLRVRNNRLIRAREQLGLTAREAAERIGINYALLLEYERLKRDPRSRKSNKEGRLTDAAWKIVNFYGLPWQELWPDAALAVVDPVRTVEVDGAQIRTLMAGSARMLPSDAPSPEEQVIDAVEFGLVLKHLKKLTDQEKKVLRYRYGIGDAGELTKREGKVLRNIGEARELTYDEVGQAIGLSRERVRQLEFAALARIRKAINKEEADNTTRVLRERAEGKET